ncbi:3-oxoacyl-[acyl-carrier-protein] reductase, partial [Pseudomonas sp. MWU13-2860]
MTPLQDKSVLITGGTAGIGLGLARAFARAGARVAISGRSQDKLDAALARLRAEGLNAAGHIADVVRPEDVARLLSATAAQAGLDVLCCNAGIFPSAPLASMSAEEWDQVQHTNVRGNFLCVQAALPFLRQAEYGRVILTSSITGPVTGYAGWSHYGASKAAQLGFMRSAALELARDDITINAVMPGNVLTEGLRELGEDY